MRKTTQASALVLLLPALVWGAASSVDPGLGEAPHTVDRRTPSTTVQGFLDATHAGDYHAAAFFLDLEGLNPEAQALHGPKLARRLRFVLDRQAWLDVATVSHEPDGDNGRGVEQLGQIPLGKGSVPIRVMRLHDATGPVWVFSADTVSSIDRLYDVYGPPLGESLPEVFFTRPLKGLEVWQWLGLIGVILGALVVSFLLERFALFVFGRLARMTANLWDDQLVVSARGPLRLLVSAAVLAGGMSFLLLPPSVQDDVNIVCRSLVIVGVAWLALRFLSVVSRLLEANVTSGKQTLANERSVRTQMAVLKRVMAFVVYVVSAAAILMQFNVVRSVGVSLLASAGVAGLVVGLAAQKSIGTLLAGIQLSITQPIRIGDSVVVEGESGTVEEINLTYVVIRVWDLRRLVVPITYFLDKPFQNWSKGPSDLLGTVNFQVDYTAEVEAMRAELARIVTNEGRALWDGKLANIKVTDASERTQTVRVLVSAATSDANFDLRCLIREKLILFLKKNPTWLPTQRTFTHPADAPAAPAHPTA